MDVGNEINHKVLLVNVLVVNLFTYLLTYLRSRYSETAPIGAKFSPADNVTRCLPLAGACVPELAWHPVHRALF